MCVLRAVQVKYDDFRPGAGAEGRAPKAVAAGDDGQEPAEAARAVAQGVHAAGDDVFREKLAAVGMAGKLKRCSGTVKSAQFPYMGGAV